MNRQVSDQRSEQVRQAVEAARRRRQGQQSGEEGVADMTETSRAVQEAIQAAREAQRGAQGSERGVQGAQRGVQGAQRGAQGSQRGAQGSQRGAQGSQRGAQGSQRGAEGRRGNQSGAGQSGMEEAVREAVAEARRRAAEVGEGNYNEMEGGWPAGSMKAAKLRQRLDASGKVPMKVNRNRNSPNVGESTPNYNKARSYRVKVDGVDLKGPVVTRTHKRTDKKTGAVSTSTSTGPSNRYFHGAPSAAAKKVVAQLQKGLKRGLPGSRNVLGMDNAVQIELTEVTKGVRKANGERFVYNYFGWRQPLDPNDPDESKRPKTISKRGVDKQTGQPTDVQVEVNFRNLAVPAKKAGSARQALQVSQNLGSMIKNLKGRSEGQRAAERERKAGEKKAASAARKAAKKNSA